MLRRLIMIHYLFDLYSSSSCLGGLGGLGGLEGLCFSPQFLLLVEKVGGAGALARRPDTNVPYVRRKWANPTINNQSGSLHEHVSQSENNGVSFKIYYTDLITVDECHVTQELCLVSLETHMLMLIHSPRGTLGHFPS